MTEKLYYKDSYIREFTATVISCKSEENGTFAVILDKTAFFPEGGGQYADIGTIGNASVIDVKISADGVITHYTDTVLSKNTQYQCRLDWESRFSKMQNHTGEHIVSGIVHSLFGYDNVGFHLGNEDVTMDYNGVLTREDLLRVEYLANKACAENIPIEISFPSCDELSSLEYRSKIELTEDVRIVTVPGYDTCACCAPHVKATGAVGMIKLLDFIKYKGGIRVHMKCGFDALADFNEKYNNVSEIAVRLSAKQSEVSLAVERLERELAEKKKECAELRTKYISSRLSEMQYTEGNLLMLEDDVDSDTMRAAANIGREKCSGVFCILCGNDTEGYRYILSSKSTPLRAFAKSLSLKGGGGGSDEMMQGMYKCTYNEIIEAFS